MSEAIEIIQIFVQHKRESFYTAQEIRFHRLNSQPFGKKLTYFIPFQKLFLQTISEREARFFSDLKKNGEGH